MILVLLFCFSITSCEITKRRYLPGYSVSWIKRNGKRLENVRLTNGLNKDKTDTVTALIEDQKSTDLTFHDEISTSVLVQQDLKVENEQKQLDSIVDYRSSISESLQKDRTIIYVKQDDPEKNPIEPEKKTKNVWRTIGIVALITISVFLFLWAGAMWPDVYIGWFGLTALIIPFHKKADISWLEIIAFFLMDLAWTGVYVLILIYAFPIWQGILIQIIGLGGVSLIAIGTEYIFRQIKIKKREKSMGNIGGEKM